MATDQARRRALDDEAKRLIVDATYSGRGHQQAGRRWTALNHWLGIPSEIGSALLGSGAAITALVGNSKWITASLALLAVALGAVRSYLRPAETAEAHAIKGNRLISLRNDVRLYRELDLQSDVDLDELDSRLRVLRSRYNTLQEDAPRQIPPWAYRAAKQSIAAGESSYEDDPLWKELTPP
jgi:hypothetical protein